MLTQKDLILIRTQCRLLSSARLIEDIEHREDSCFVTDTLLAAGISFLRNLRTTIRGRTSTWELIFISDIELDHAMRQRLRNLACRLLADTVRSLIISRLVDIDRQTHVSWTFKFTIKDRKRLIGLQYRQFTGLKELRTVWMLNKLISQVTLEDIITTNAIRRRLLKASQTSGKHTDS